jgi:hypothetical protein
MTTTLTFAAPEDLSVGRVRVFRGEDTVADWISTPSDKTVDIDDLAPGDYSALIEPLGLPPTPFIFNVAAGVANIVATPLISVLSVVGPWAMMAALKRSGQTSGEGEAVAAMEMPPADPDQRRAFTIGLSQDETPGAVGGWRPYAGEAAVSSQLIDGALHLIIRPPVRKARAGRLAASNRVRLSASIARTRVERMMTPLFAGGVRIIFSTSAMTTEDVGFRVIPNDEGRRALVQALLTGGPEEAGAVARDLAIGDGVDRFLSGGPEEDPWAAVTVALLNLRFPSVFAAVGADFVPRLVRRYGWIPDVHLLAARQALSDAGAADEDRRRAGNRALQALRKARKLGAPYFAYANQLMGEVLAALVDAPLGKGFQTRARRERETWLANAPLQRTAGAAFSWTMADRERFSGKPLSTRSKLAGNLDERYARVIFRGLIDTSKITIRRPDRPRRKAPVTEAPQANEASAQVGAPASLSARRARRAGAGTSRAEPGAASKASLKIRSSVSSTPVTVFDPDDPNKGQFGGDASAGGYHLSAAFAPTDDPDIVEVRLKVQSGDERAASYSDVVEFVLHPTFQPRVVTSTFRGREAVLNVYAWGGFTVGARLPGRGVALELDLSEAPGAPDIIRDR